MKQRFSVMKMTLTYTAGARDPLGLNKTKSLKSHERGELKLKR